jgi:hypothetical protein
MTSKLPSSLTLQKRSGFAVIDPETELYHHKIGRAQHVAISYVWGDWTENPEAGHHLRHWPILRQRLLRIVGRSASQFMKIESGNSSRCWLDCKCINQESEGDKKYWVPRMDEIYSEARCTVLLLRNINLTSLKEAEGQLACDLDDDDHACHLTQICTTLTCLSPELEAECIDTLKILNAGEWRKRAWIFQEILLSKEYILSGEDGVEIKLGDAATIAYLLFQRYPQHKGLGEFASWCRRLFRLRLYYFEYKICPSNLLQLASSLEATLPCDKYYALCGLLRLKTLKYDSSHSERQALESVILALTKAGRLSWLSAIPPAINRKISVDGRFLPYVERRLDQGLGSLYANTKGSSITQVVFTTRHVGHITKIYNALELLQAAILLAKAENPSPQDFLPHISIIPALLMTVSREIVETLTCQPILGRLCRVLKVPEQNSGSTVLMKLLAIQSPTPFQTHQSLAPDDLLADTELVAASAWAVQHHVNEILNSVEFLEWCPIEKPESRYHAIGSKGCHIGTQVCIVIGDPLLMAVEMDVAERGSKETRWITMLQQPASQDKGVQFNPSASSFASLSARWNGWKQRDLSFSI